MGLAPDDATLRSAQEAVPSGGRWWWLRLAAPVAAVMACLQPAIDPVFLTLLSQAAPVPLAMHGLVVGVTQGSAAMGALMSWRLGGRLPRWFGLGVALLALLASLLTPFAPDALSLLGLRAAYGLAMGTIYATAMASFAARKPAGAYAFVLLAQLLAATLVSLALPALAVRVGAGGALMGLALVPLLALAGMAGLTKVRQQAALHRDSPTPLAGWAMAWACFWFICATMMVWSLSGAMATAAGFDEQVIGRAVALGSLAGAATALAVIRERRLVPLPLTAVLVGLSLLSPLVLTDVGGGLGYVASMVMLNIGSTAIIIRTSALATAMSLSSRFRVFVAATHNLGMTAGPALGSGMIWAMPDYGLLIAAGLAVAGGVVAVLIASTGGRGGLGPRLAASTLRSIR